MKNKIFSGTLALILTIFCLAVPLSAYASETLGTNSQNLETNTEVKIIQENLTLYKNENRISLVTITDENKLLVELKNANSSLSVLDVKTTIDAFNNQLVLENGNGELTNLLVKNLQSKPNIVLEGRIHLCVLLSLEVLA